MDSDGSSDEDYENIELHELIEKEFFDSSESDGDAEMMMLMSIQEEMDREGGRILNFKGMIKGRRVFEPR